MKLSFDAEGQGATLSDGTLQALGRVHQLLHEKAGAGRDFLGWLEYEESFDHDFARTVQSLAIEIKAQADVLVVLGIGGSYLGARAFIEALTDPYGQTGVEILFAGYHLSGRSLASLLSYLEGKRVYLNVISKSGKTLETALAFRVLKDWMKRREPETYHQRIIATTDPTEGALRIQADQAGFRTLPIPKDIGGRYSVFTAVGLLPIAVAGFRLDDVLFGLKQGIIDFGESDPDRNPAYRYAGLRYGFWQEGRTMEIFALSDPRLHYLGEWLKQLFGESEGKEGKGLYPSALHYSTDLHSLGQWLQEGPGGFFETFVGFRESEIFMTVPSETGGADRLGPLEGRSFNEVNRIMLDAAKQAHLEGGVPILSVEMDCLDAGHLAYLMYFFMKACAASGYLLGVNPFDQPGVEAYKRHMRESDSIKKQE